MALSPGTRLGPYEIQSAIGAGGMGEVYKARDTRLDRTVAIKILPEALAADPQFRDRFDREARTISHFTHPNICTLYDVGEHAGTSFPVSLAGVRVGRIRQVRGVRPAVSSGERANADLDRRGHATGVAARRQRTVLYRRRRQADRRW
jgi:serine/threonine protein kinase